jgi:hypothetical protein
MRKIELPIYIATGIAPFLVIAMFWSAYYELGFLGERLRSVPHFVFLILAPVMSLMIIVQVAIKMKKIDKEEAEYKHAKICVIMGIIGIIASIISFFIWWNISV